jgi:hypothetical protein
VEIAAQSDEGGSSILFERHDNGDGWRWDGRTPCTTTACPGWTLIDRNPRTIASVPLHRIPARSRLSSGSR